MRPPRPSLKKLLLRPIQRIFGNWNLQFPAMPDQTIATNISMAEL
jgi:hypothetical protein